MEIEIQIASPRRFINSNHFKSFAWALGSSLISTLTALQFRLYPWFRPITVTVYGFYTSIVFSLIGWILTGRSGSNRNRKPSPMSTKRRLLLLLGRALSGTVSTIFYHLCLGKIPASLTATVLCLTPFVTLILTRILLKESLTIVKLIAFALTATGVVMRSFLDSSKMDTIVTSDMITGIIFGVASALMYAISYLFIKQLISVNPMEMLFFNGLTGFLISLIYALIAGELIIPHCGVPAIILLLASTQVIGAVYCIFKSCEYGEAGSASAMILGSGVIFAFIWDMILFGLRPNLLQCIASGFVVTGILFNGFCTHLPSLPILNKSF